MIDTIPITLAAPRPSLCSVCRCSAMLSSLPSRLTSHHAAVVFDIRKRSDFYRMTAKKRVAAASACYRCIGCMLSASAAGSFRRPLSSCMVSAGWSVNCSVFRTLILSLSVDVAAAAFDVRRNLPALLALCFGVDFGTQPKLFRGGGDVSAVIHDRCSSVPHVAAARRRRRPLRSRSSALAVLLDFDSAKSIGPVWVTSRAGPAATSSGLNSAG